jgi:hypothetical protein
VGQFAKVVSAMANYYLLPSRLGHHIWSAATDPIKGLVFQACSCGWKRKVQDFYRAVCTYDFGDTFEENYFLAVGFWDMT